MNEENVRKIVREEIGLAIDARAKHDGEHPFGLRVAARYLTEGQAKDVESVAFRVISAVLGARDSAANARSALVKAKQKRRNLERICQDVDRSIAGLDV